MPVSFSGEYAIAAMKQLPGTIRPSVVGPGKFLGTLIIHGGRVVIDDRHIH